MRKYIEFVVFGLGVAATVLLLFNAFSVEGEMVSGFKLAFGGKLEVGGDVSFNTGKFQFNILYVLILLLPAAGGVVQAFVTEPIGSIGALVLFVLAVVLTLVVKETDFVVNLIDSKIQLEPKLEALGIVSLVLTGLGGLLSLFKLIDSK